MRQRPEQRLVQQFVAWSRPLKLSIKPFCCGFPGASDVSCQPTPGLVRPGSGWRLRSARFHCRPAIVFGRPRRRITSFSSRATRRPEIEVSAISARHPGVQSSTTARIRNRRPSVSWSCNGVQAPALVGDQRQSSSGRRVPIARLRPPRVDARSAAPRGERRCTRFLLTAWPSRRSSTCRGDGSRNRRRSGASACFQPFPQCAIVLVAGRDNARWRGRSRSPGRPAARAHLEGVTQISRRLPSRAGRHHFFPTDPSARRCPAWLRPASVSAGRGSPPPAPSAAWPPIRPVRRTSPSIL